jgi:hypothetical protein
MKKVVVLIVGVIILGLTFSSCESKSGQRARERKKMEMNDQVVIFTPEKIGVTEIEQRFIPYPQYDGGTGIWASFSIGIQHGGKIYQVNLSENRFFSEKLTEEEAKTDPRIAVLLLTHYFINNTPKEYLKVVVENKEVVRISRDAAFFPDETFYPEKIIWKK